MDTQRRDSRRIVRPEEQSLILTHGLLAACICLFPLGARATVDLESTVTAGVSSTDNLTLDAEDPQSEFVYELIPTIKLAQESSRASVNAAYRIEAFHYDRRSDSEVYQLFDADANFELQPENFFIGMGGNRNQAIRNPELAIANDNLALTGNRIERNEFYVEPSFQYAAGSSAAIHGTYRAARIRYGEDVTVPGSGRHIDEDTFSFSIDNRKRQRGLSWAVRYRSEKSDSPFFDPWEYRRAEAEFGTWIGEGQRLFAVAGKESAWDQLFDPGLKDSFWEAGISKDVAGRFNAEFAVGERSFGSSRRGSLGVIFRGGSMKLVLEEEPTTQELNPYDRGGLLLPNEPNDFLSRPGTAERYVSKRTQWNLDLEGSRATVSFRVFDESREQRIQPDGTPLDDESQTGIYATIGLSAGARTNVSILGERIKREFDLERKSVLERFSLSVGYKLGQRSQASVEYSRTVEDSTYVGSFRRYSANVVSLLLTRTF